MRAVILFAVLAAFAFSKDNFVFDYHPNERINERIERLEREVGELKSRAISLQIGQEAIAKRGSDPKIGKLEAANARLSGEVTKLGMSVAKLAKTPAPKAAAPQPQKTIVQTSAAENIERFEKIEADLLEIKYAIAEKNGGENSAESSAPPIAAGGQGMDAIKIKIETLSDRLFTLEADIKAAKERLDQSAGIPFDEFLPVKKATFEYFLLGLTAFVLLMFIMLLSASTRAGRAERKIEQLVKLYQSSSRKSEDRK